MHLKNTCEQCKKILFQRNRNVRVYVDTAARRTQQTVQINKKVRARENEN